MVRSKPDHSDRLEIESNAFGRQGSEGSLNPYRDCANHLKESSQ